MSMKKTFWGFHVFVADLELVTATRRDGAFDEIALIELLQKLFLSVDLTDDLKLVNDDRLTM